LEAWIRRAEVQEAREPTHSPSRSAGTATDRGAALNLGARSARAGRASARWRSAGARHEGRSVAHPEGSSRPARRARSGATCRRVQRGRRAHPDARCSNRNEAPPRTRHDRRGNRPGSLPICAASNRDRSPRGRCLPACPPCPLLLPDNPSCVSAFGWSTTRAGSGQRQARAPARATAPARLDSAQDPLEARVPVRRLRDSRRACRDSSTFMRTRFLPATTGRVRSRRRSSSADSRAQPEPACSSQHPTRRPSGITT
jgi:hypothetical protein